MNTQSLQLPHFVTTHTVTIKILQHTDDVTSETSVNFHTKSVTKSAAIQIINYTMSATEVG